MKYNKAVEELQKLLNQSGHDIEIDGLFGNQTSAAIEDMNVPGWIKTAMKEIGTVEIPGSKHNQRIMEYHKISGGFSTDEIPWCGSFVNWVMRKNGFETVPIPARAKSWTGFGKSSCPIVGSIAVKERNGGGHVCFVVGRNIMGDLYCLGGNQSNGVNIKLYPKDVFIDFRVPKEMKTDDLPYYALKSEKAGSEA